MKKLLALILAVILVLSCAACAASTTKTDDAQPTDTSTTTESSTETTAEEEAPADAAETKDITIGLSIYSADISYFVAMQHGVEDYCAQQGYEVIVHDEKMDETEMVSGCINLLNQGVDALLVSPFKPEALGPVATLAAEKNIPFIILDIGNGDGAYPYDAFIVSDNVGGGRLAGEYLVNLLKEGGEDLSATKTAVITIDPSNVANHSRGTGFVEVMEENGISVESSIYAKEATADATYPVATSILVANPGIRAIFCSNDEEAVGASQAAADLGLEDVIIIGFDGQETAIDALKNDLITASVRQYPSEMGVLGVQLAMKVINGETIDFDDAETKTFYSPLDMLDKSNME
ncbi:MAG: substrate-binding domain-containing protein [Oscillospiraceae bacterium]|nr:substrate-binding domain-containing protein [Clostridiales bacterium]MDY2718014.1 substrate-binding domain-containing protein [Oscillospiraceae bacterium]